MRPGWLALISLAACGRVGFDSASPEDAAPDALPVTDCTVLADGTPCDDRNVCTAESSCQAGVCKPPTQQASCTVARSDTEFGSAQGSGGWFYGFWSPEGVTPYNPDVDFELGVYDDAESVFQPMVPLGNFIYLAAWGAHPQFLPTIAVPIRRWVSDVTGPAEARLGGRKADINCGDGVEVRLLVDGELKSTKAIAADDGTGFDIGIAIDLVIGSRVDLLLTPIANESCDTTEMELKISSPPE